MEFFLKKNVIVVVLALVIIVFALQSLKQKSSLRCINDELKIARNDLSIVSERIRAVKDSLQQSSFLIDSLLKNVGRSQNTLDSLSAKIGSLTNYEKKMFKQTVHNIDVSLESIDKEKEEARLILDLLDNANFGD